MPILRTMEETESGLSGEPGTGITVGLGVRVAEMVEPGVGEPVGISMIVGVGVMRGWVRC